MLLGFGRIVKCLELGNALLKMNYVQKLIWQIAENTTETCIVLLVLCIKLCTSTYACINNNDADKLR